MPKSIDNLAPRDAKNKEWRVVIETPKGCHNKYKYSPQWQCYELAKVLPEGMVFPFDFGFLPSTQGEDGDPLDVLLLMDKPAFCGCVIRARLLGVIEATQTETDGKTGRNDRLVAAPLQARLYADISSVKDLEKNVLEEIERFFVNYNEQDGKKFKLLGVHGPKRALRLAKMGIKAFGKKK